MRSAQGRRVVMMNDACTAHSGSSRLNVVHAGVTAFMRLRRGSAGGAGTRDDMQRVCGELWRVTKEGRALLASLA